MVDLSKRNGTARASLDRASRAIAEALAEGVNERELQDMVTTVAADQVAEQHEIQGLFPDFHDHEIIYTETEVPEGLIDLPAASKKYHCPVGTLQMWVHRGRLQTYGRLKAPARGGGYLLLREDELVHHMQTPRNKGGRPRKPPTPH